MARSSWWATLICSCSLTSYHSSPAYRRPWNRLPPSSRRCEAGGNKSLSPGLRGLSMGLYFSQEQGQSLGKRCYSLQLYLSIVFFLNEKIVSCFPVHFQDHLQHHRLWGEECPSVFFIFRIYRNFFHLESSLNTFLKTFPRQFFFAFWGQFSNW